MGENGTLKEGKINNPFWEYNPGNNKPSDSWMLPKIYQF
jgi:hypothetical protein